MAESAPLALAADPVAAAGTASEGPARGPVVLIGNSNVGKSALFGALTGTYVTVSNYPGTTVEVTRGHASVVGRRVEVVDTPGTASFLPSSEDERVTRTPGLLFRALQRQLDLSVILVHRTRKNAVGGVAAGQGLRSSSDLHAFGDSNLYLRRLHQRLVLSTEHRAAPASPPVWLELVAHPAAMTLEVVAERHEASPVNLADQVLGLLPDGTALTRSKLRDTLSVQNQRLGHVLESLQKAGRIRHTPAGWQRIS